MSNMFDSGEFGQGPLEEFLARFFGGGGPRQPAPRQASEVVRLMSGPAREMLAAAAGQAMQWGNSDVDTDHLLWAATKVEPVRTLLQRAGTDPDRLAEQVEQKHRHGEGALAAATPALTPGAKRALLEGRQLARALGASYVGPEHLLLALVVQRDSAAGQMLAQAGVTVASLEEASSGHGQPGSVPTSSTPTVDEYGRDLTAMAREGKLDPVIGRDEEIEDTIEVLSRRTKNNPVLIGEAGVGKTAIVEGIAQRIADDDVPATLRGRRVVQLDMVGMVAGTRYRGDFEERLKQVIDEIRSHGDELVIFIDEMHTVVGAGGSEGAVGAGNILKPALARGELHIVGATTLDEYRKIVERDAALERRFQPVFVPEPSPEDTISILRGLRDRYEAHHQVRYTEEALDAAAELSDRYISDRFLPDKAIDLMDQAGARVRLRTRTPATDVRQLERRFEQLRRDRDQAVSTEQYERAAELRDQLRQVEEELASLRAGGAGVPEVTADDIAEVVSRRTGVPVSQLTEEEMQRLGRLEEQLHQRIVGQEEAVESVAQAVRRSRAGLGDPNRPIGSFLFLGPTGVGKTELARALAEALFGGEDRMVRFDMSEFQERHTVSRLVGAPPGYVGYDEAGQLTEAVRRRPYGVVLLDEIEKAHPDVFNVLLQVMDDGRLTDAQGRTVNFKNTVLIMTSNLGSELITGGRTALGFGGDGRGEEPSLRDRLMPRLREAFRPEFLNRIDEIIIFRRLDHEQVRQITDLLLEQTRRRIHAQDIQVDFTPEAVDWLADRGFEPDFGARPLRRTVQREVDDRLANMLLSGELHRGESVLVRVVDGRIVAEVSGPRVIDLSETEEEAAARH